MLAARTPDVVPNHQCPAYQCASPPSVFPLYPSPRHVYPSQPVPITLPRPSVTSVPHTHLPTRFATPHASPPGTEDRPSPSPSPELLDAFSLLHTTSPLPHTTFPRRPTYSRYASPNAFAALESPYDSDDKDPPLRHSFVLLPPPPSLLTLAPPTFCYLNPFYRPSLTSCTRLSFHPCPLPSTMAPSSLLNPAATFISSTLVTLAGYCVCSTTVPCSTCFF
jgi:hypothetical protein